MLNKLHEDQTLHILLKYGEHIAPPPGTIKLHQDVLKEHGSVWMGKFGKSIGKPVLKILKDQIKSKKPTYVFLVKSARGAYTIHAAKLEDIGLEADDDKLIPNYYQNRKSKIEIWFKINKIFQVKPEILETLKGYTSRMPINQSVRRSMAGAFYVTLKDGQMAENFKPTKK